MNMETEKSITFNELKALESRRKRSNPFDGQETRVLRYLELNTYDRLALQACTGLALIIVLVFLFEYFFNTDPARFQESPWALIILLGALPSVLFMLIWYFRSQDAAQKRRLERERLQNESFAEALRLLEHQDIPARIGAIHSLGRMIDGPLNRRGGWSIHDHNAVIAILAGYIRATLEKKNEQDGRGKVADMPADVRSAINVLGGRRWAGMTDEIRLDFTHVNFQNIDFYGVSLPGADFFEARLGGANFKEAKLKGANFARAFLVDVNFKRADLEGVNLGGASLGKAKLRGANLKKANLSGAILYESDLQNAYLQGAILQGASLSGANLKGAKLTGADLTGAYYSSTTRFPDKFSPEASGMYKSDY